MKSIKTKAFFLALGTFAMSVAFAQDTPKTPKPDTSKSPKPDTTGMINHSIRPVKLQSNTAAITSLFIMNNEYKIAAKKEVTGIKIS